jgi:hypothetical protein
VAAAFSGLSLPGVLAGEMMAILSPGLSALGITRVVALCVLSGPLRRGFRCPFAMMVVVAIKAIAAIKNKRFIIDYLVDVLILLCHH